MVAEFFYGAPIVVRLPAIPQPELSPLGNGYIYFDSGTNKLRASENGGAYVDLVGGGGGGTLAATLALGNTTGGNDIVVSTGFSVRGAAELTLASAVGSDLVFTGRGATTNLNQAGETTLDPAFTGAGRTSLIGALNSLVDGAVTPTASALSAVLAVGNTTGANDIEVTGGQKIVSAVAASLVLEGSTTVEFHSGGGALRWSVDGGGMLVPAIDDNYDIGSAGIGRIRTLYAGTSVVVGATVTIDGTTNSITSSANLTLDTAAAGTMNLGATNAATINLGAGVGATAILAAADVTISGDLTVNGTTTTVNSANLTVTDPLIYANNGGADPSFAGLAWRQGAALDVVMDWNPTNARMEFGRFNTVGGTVVPSGALTTLIDARISNLSLAGTTVTADAALTVVATTAALTLEATGANNVALRTAGVTRHVVNGSGHIVPQADDTYDLGITATNRFRTGYFGTSVVIGSTVTIGSAAVTGSGALTVSATAATLGLAATGANVVAVSTAGTARLTVAADGGLGYAGLVANPTVGGATEGKLYYNSASQELRLSANGAAYVALATATSVTLQQAYDNGSSIATTTADGAIALSGSAANNDSVLTVAKTPAGAQSGSGVAITMNASTTGNGLTVTQAGSGLAALFSGATISCPGAGASSERFGTGALAAGASSLAVGNAAFSGAASTTAVGASASASATFSTAIGNLATSSGADSVAIGKSAVVAGTGTGSISIGTSSSSPGDGSVTVGYSASAAMTDAIAIGKAASVGVGAGGSIAIGRGATVGVGSSSCVVIGVTASTSTFDMTVVVGGSASAGASRSVVVGRTASTGAGSTNSVAVGFSATTATFAGCIALGAVATCTAANQLVSGSSTAPITTVIFGEGDTDATPPATVTLRVTDAAVASGADGSALSLRAGSGDGFGAGGLVAVTGGIGGATGAGGTVSVVGGPGGVTSGNGGSVGISSGSAFDGNGGPINITAGDAVGVGKIAGFITIAAGNSFGSGLAGSISMTCGTGDGSQQGGGLLMSAGIGGLTDGDGGNASISAGPANGVGTGGSVSLSGGTSPSGTGGEVTIDTGNAASLTRVRVLPTGLVGVGSGTPLSTLDVQGSFGFGVTSIAASTTATAAASVWLVNATAGAVTLTLPTAASASRRTYNIKKTDSSLNAVTVDGAGAETIDGAATQTLVAQYESIQIVSDGVSWYVI